MQRPNSEPLGNQRKRFDLSAVRSPTEGFNRMRTTDDRAFTSLRDRFDEHEEIKTELEEPRKMPVVLPPNYHIFRLPTRRTQADTPIASRQQH
jgi:hypothetical protein